MAAGTPLIGFGADPTSVPFEIHTMAWVEENRSPFQRGAHRHNHYVAIWFISGSGYHVIDLERFELKPGTVYCIAPGQVHELVTEAPAEGFVISFTEEFLGVGDHKGLLFRPAPGAGISHVVAVTEEMNAELQGVVSRLATEYDNFLLFRSEILRDYLRIFLVYLNRRLERPQPGGTHDRNTGLWQQFTALVDKHFVQHHQVADYASMLVVSPNYLNDVIKKVTGFPASHHIRQRIVLEAKRHAMYTGSSMKEIAYELGFDDVAHFSRFFKSLAGVGFAEFRKSCERLQ